MRLTEIADDSRPFSTLVIWCERLGGWIKVADLVNSNPETTTLESVLRGVDGIDLELLREEIEKFENVNHSEASVVKSGDVRFRPLLTAPSKILCVGLNYAGHIKEFGHEYPSEPVIFSKASSALTSCSADIILPPVSERVDYEAELVVVIGKRGKDISESDALDYVAGYCCGNDVSARDWQKEKPSGQWFLGKSFDSFAPIGPQLVTKDEVGNPNNLKIESRLNGKVMQSACTSQFIYSVQRVISYISQVMTLEPCDLIFTGTPDGIGDVRKPPRYLSDGDVFEVEIEKLGVLMNTVRRQSLL